MVGTISASFPAVTVVLSIIFLKESITPSQAFSILIILLGVIISSLDFRELRNRQLLTSRGVLLALITALLMGVYWTFIKIPVREIGWFWAGLIPIFTFPLVLVFMKLRNIKLNGPKIKGSLLPLFANAVLLGIGSFGFNYAISKDLTAIVAPIAGSYPTLFVILAYLVFKDSITRKEIVGIIITLVGIILLSTFSV